MVKSRAKTVKQYLDELPEVTPERHLSRPRPGAKREEREINNV